MTEPVGQQNNTSLSWRVRVCHTGWKVLLFVWGTLIVGIAVGTVANLNTTTIGQTGETGTSLTDILAKLFITQLIRTFPFPIFFGLGSLVLLTVLSWLGSHEKPSEHLRPLSQQNRVHVLKRLRWYYEQALSQSLQGAVQTDVPSTPLPAPQLAGTCSQAQSQAAISRRSGVAAIQTSNDGKLTRF